MTRRLRFTIFAGKKLLTKWRTRRANGGLRRMARRWVLSGGRGGRGACRREAGQNGKIRARGVSLWLGKGTLPNAVFVIPNAKFTLPNGKFPIPNQPATLPKARVTRLDVS